MAKQARATIKTWFESGDEPTQQQFWDWLDSFVHQDDPLDTVVPRANQTEAEAAIDNNKVMTPLQTKNAIVALTTLANVPTLNNEVTTAIATAKQEAIDALQNNAPLTLDQFNELAAAINDDPDFYNTVTALINGRLEKAQNLNDIPDKAAARNNLDVYSKGETFPIKSVSGITNFNNVLDSGVYGFQSNTFSGSLPDAGWGSILVERINATQIVQKYHSTIGVGLVYTRFTTNGGALWTSWQTLSTVASSDSRYVAIDGNQVVNDLKKFNLGRIQVGSDGGQSRQFRFDGKISADNNTTWKDLFTSRSVDGHSILGNNLDSYTELGHFRVLNATNVPIGYTSGANNDFHVIVYPIDQGANWINQVLYDVRSNRHFVRTKVGADWGEWQRNITENSDPSTRGFYTWWSSLGNGAAELINNAEGGNGGFNFWFRNNTTSTTLARLLTMDNTGRMFKDPDGDNHEFIHEGNVAQYINPIRGRNIAELLTSGGGNAQVQGCVDMTISEDEQVIYLLDNFHDKVEVVDLHGNHVRSWLSTGSGNGDFNNGSGIFNLNNEIFIIDNNDDTVQVFSTTGTYLRSWGGNGSGNGQFLDPTAITGYNGEIYVADSGRDDIQVFNTAGSFIRKFGSTGSGNGQLRVPRSMVVYEDELYVLDSVRHDVQVLNPANGSFIRKFGSEGSVNGQFLDPFGLSVYSGEVYVCDPERKLIQVFSTDGVYKRKWGRNGSGLGQLFAPVAIIVNQDEAFVLDDGIDRLLVFI